VLFRRVLIIAHVCDMEITGDVPQQNGSVPLLHTLVTCARL